MAHRKHKSIRVLFIHWVKSHGHFHTMMEDSLILAPPMRLAITQCISELTSTDGASLLYGCGADRAWQEKKNLCTGNQFTKRKCCPIACQQKVNPLFSKQILFFSFNSLSC